MLVKERQERDREAVSQAILDAARELFGSEGYQNVSTRKIADRIEYSPAAIYGCFPSKDDIFFALAKEGFWLLSAPEDPSHRERLQSPLMRRAFDLDVLRCPRCAGRMRLIATIDDPAVIQRILTHLGLAGAPAGPHSRASPSATRVEQPAPPGLTR